MFDIDTLTHQIQMHIIGVLAHQKYARFRDMRPDKCDTNLYSYHLKVLQREGYITKAEKGYSLGKKGLIYVDRVSAESMNIRTQPKIVIMFVVQDGDGNVLLYRRVRQPFIEQWTLPCGGISIDDETIESAAKREAREKLGLNDVEPRHAGDCYIRTTEGRAVVMSTLVHVFRFETDKISSSDTIQWARPHRLNEFELAPAVEQIVTRAFFNDPYFFEEYTQTLSE